MTGRDDEPTHADQPPPRQVTRRRSPSTRRTAPDPFGDVLPDRTRDEEAGGWGDREHDDDERLRGEVPPHHR